MLNRQQYLSYLQLPQVKAFLDVIAWAEGGTYNKLFGGGTFTGNQHPNRIVTAGNYTSTAAGRYQFLYRTWIEIKNRLGLPDFSPVNQDIAALDLINQRGQLKRLINNDLIGVLKGLGCAWAALPYSNCKQKERGIQETISYYNNALKVYGKGSPVITEKDIPAIFSNNIPEKKKDESLIYLALGFAALILLA